MTLAVPILKTPTKLMVASPLKPLNGQDCRAVILTVSGGNRLPLWVKVWEGAHQPVMSLFEVMLLHFRGVTTFRRLFCLLWEVPSTTVLLHTKESNWQLVLKAELSAASAFRWLCFNDSNYGNIIASTTLRPVTSAVQMSCLNVAGCRGWRDRRSDPQRSVGMVVESFKELWITGVQWNTNISVLTGCNFIPHYDLLLIWLWSTSKCGALLDSRLTQRLLFRLIGYEKDFHKKTANRKNNR